MDELTRKYNQSIQTGGGSTVSQASTATQQSGGIMGDDRVKAINDMYDANMEAQKAGLQESGAQALSDAQANRDKIAGLYQAKMDAADVNWERQRRNFLEGAATSGINTGARSQAELSMMGMRQKAQANLGGEQAQAEAEADRNIADISRNTQAAINEAVAKNDYQRAAAIFDEYNNQYNRYMERAESLASYGDFSGYAAIYGQEQAQQMFNSWAAQNPRLAYTIGAITQQQYNNLITGQPINATGPALGVGGGGGGGSDYTGYGSGIPVDYSPEKYPMVAAEIGLKAGAENGGLTQDQYNDLRTQYFGR